MKKQIYLRSALAFLLVVVIGFFSFVMTSNLPNQITGGVTAQVFVTGLDSANCSVVLKQGMNVVSFFCADESLSVNASMINATNHSLNYYAVYVFNPNNLNDSWSSYNPHLPSYAYQTLNNLERRKGYVIIMNGTGEFSSAGLRFVNTNIMLQKGWNLIGYPTYFSGNITDVLEQIDGKYTQVHAYQILNGTNEWRSYTPESGGTLEVMDPMIGYWIYMNATGAVMI